MRQGSTNHGARSSDLAARHAGNLGSCLIASPPVDRVRSERLEPFVRMLAHLREPLLLMSRTGAIIAGNVAAAEALGTTTPALVGTSLSTHASEPGDLDTRLVEVAAGD